MFRWHFARKKNLWGKFCENPWRCPDRNDPVWGMFVGKFSGVIFHGRFVMRNVQGILLGEY